MNSGNEYVRVSDSVRNIVSSIEETGTDLSQFRAIFDIDGTLLTDSNVSHQYQSSGDIFKWQYRSVFAPIEPIVQLYLWLQSKGIHMILLTGRKENLRAATVKNLQKMGISSWDQLIMKPMGGRIDTGKFKESMRRNIEAKCGHPCILLNIGDQDTDFLGGYSQYDFKLPSSY